MKTAYITALFCNFALYAMIAFCVYTTSNLWPLLGLFFTISATNKKCEKCGALMEKEE